MKAFLIWLTLALSIQAKCNLKYGFKWLNFTFEDSQQYEDYESNKVYENCIVSGIKGNSKGDLFVSTPRWKNGVPSTFNLIVNIQQNVLLQPFPSWEFNQEGDPNRLQSILGFEIDRNDIIYLLDQGKIANESAIPGSIKLVTVNSISGEILKTYVFNESIASTKNSFLNDLVIDSQRQWAYITDSASPLNKSQPLEGAIIALNLQTGDVRRIMSGFECMQDDPSLWVTINKEHVRLNSQIKTGADGVALSCEGDFLY